MVQRDARRRDAQLAHLREVGLHHAASLVHLAEYHLARLPVHSAPCPDSPFKCPTKARRELGVAAPDLVEYRHRPNARRSLEQRDDFSVEDLSERVGPPARAGYLLLGRQLVDRARYGRRWRR